MIRYNFHIENFTCYPVTGAVDSNVLESSLYPMEACLVMYTGRRQLPLFTTYTRPLTDPYNNTPAITSPLTHPYISRCNFIFHPSLHIPLQFYSSLIPTYPAATSCRIHPNISRCNTNSFPILKNNCAVAVALLRSMH